MIKVENLCKSFKIYQKPPGLKGSLKALFKRDYFYKNALDNVSLQVEPGEILGLVGANGAGKTTLVKILSGIIYPTSGEVSVLGYNPWKRDNRYRKQLSLIMGQKAQLWWDLPAFDSFLLLKEIYQISDKNFYKNIDYLSNSLNISHQMKTPVRKLSLGERMKVELMATLLHDPKVIFLDEPTIGLDLMSQRAVRSFLAQYRKEKNPIIILTSHYMQDIEELCRRIALIKNGSIIYDGPIDKIHKDYSQFQSINFEVLDSDIGRIQNFLIQKFPENEKEFIDNKIKLRLKKELVGEATKELLEHFSIDNLSINQIDISKVIENYLQHDQT
ncbi:MAG: ATP-binding cassette domain-containing protein [Halobacteriovoraceae bacterium]|nr:ATP-binding cassette domain-containing protein [Halobacteriovoraceae bacterium]MCB9095209.1 ATP-binding cassette domain-containing protein [Halobacteriovoraceae bacterium]